MDRPASTDLPQAFPDHARSGTAHDTTVDDLLTLSKLETTPGRTHEGEVDVPAMLTALKNGRTGKWAARHHHISLIADSGLRLSGNEEELRKLPSPTSSKCRALHAAGRVTSASPWKLDGDSPVFAVRDTGEGIAPQHIPHLTNASYRVDTARSRTPRHRLWGFPSVKHILLRP